MTEAILERKKGQLGLPKGDFGMAEETRVLKEQEEGVPGFIRLIATGENLSLQL